MPPLWLKICGQIGPTGTYNRKPLAAWFSDLLLRTKQLKARYLVITPSYQAAQGVARPLEPAYYLLLTTYYLLLTTYCLLLTANYLLLTAYYLLLTTYCLLLTAYYLLLTTYYFPGLIFLNQKDFVDPSKVPTKELPEIEIELSSGEVQAKIRDWALPLQVSRW